MSEHAPDPPPAIATREIPSTGARLPVIGLGTWQAFDIGDAPEPLAARVEVLKRFFAGGGRLIDSSPMYGRAEAVVGALLPEVDGGESAFIATKVWIEGRDEGVAQMRDSTRKLGGRVDLMQVHNLVDWRAQLPTLRAWKREGLLSYLGVTHYQRGAFETLERLITRERLDFVQLPYSALTRDAERRLLPAARDHGVAVLVMRPFEGGALFDRVRGRPLPSWASELGCASWAQLALKFILGHPTVTSPIPATSSPAHLADNLEAGVGPLPDDALRERIAAAIRGDA